MRTETIEIFKFSELTEMAKEKAINWYRNDLDLDIQIYYDEAHATVDKFNQLFGVKNGSRSWLEFDLSGIDENLLDLTGLRLRTYVINNFFSRLYKGKYYSLWSNTEKADNVYGKKLKSRHSKVIFNNDCVLTGVDYDNCMLQPVYELIEWSEKSDYHSYQTFENLINDCYKALEQSIEETISYLNSDTSIIENIEANDYEFYIDGSKY